MARLARFLVLLALLLAATGCGGSSGPGTGGGSAETEAGTVGQVGEAGEDTAAPGLKNDPIYIEAGNICVNLPIDQLAAQYGVEATPAAVSTAVAKDYAAADRKKAEQGCRAALEAGNE